MAYGDNLQQVASDDFESGSISGSWTNGGGFGAMSVNSGDAIAGSAGAICLAARSSETFADAQYSQIISGGQTQGGTSAVVRKQAGTATAHYQGQGASFFSNWRILEIDSGGEDATLASSATNWALLTAGDMIRMEAEGTTLRFGGDRTGSDIQYVTTTDATLTSGDPGISAIGAATTNNRIESWTGGDISAAGGTLRRGGSLGLLGVGR